MKNAHCLVALSLTLFACEVTSPDTDASIGMAQPCGLLGSLPCTTTNDAGPGGGAVVDAGAPLVDAGNTPPGTGGLQDSGVIGPRDGGTGMLDATTDSGPGDAATSIGGDAGSGADAQTDTGTPSNGDGGATFPPVSDPSAKGPYTPKTINNTGPGGTYTIFHPAELAPNGALNPIVSWGNGGFTTPVDYPYLPHLASHGFVVVASNDAAVTGPQVRAGIDWIVQQNETASSPFYKKLDVHNIAGVGYSNGGLAVLDVADDPRYVTLVIISGANTSEASRTANTPKQRTPTAYLCTEDDASKSNCSADFQVAKVPAFFGVMKGSGHFDVTTAFGLVGVPAIIDRLTKAMTAWLRWRQMGDGSFKPTFVGSDCLLCKDTNWAVQQKMLQ